jgi:hypothetical protein
MASLRYKQSMRRNLPRWLALAFGAPALAGLLFVIGGPGTASADGGVAPSADAGAPPSGDDAGAPSKTCLASLRERGVEFVEWPTKAVRTPIRLTTGVLGSLRLILRERKPGAPMPTMDCELARALLDAAPTFEMVGVRDLFFSGIYEYRTRRRSTKLSEHAHGLAIDVHQFGTVDGRILDVEHDFEQGVGEWPSNDQVACVGAPERPEARVLRTLACALHAGSAFREIITADDNADHYNHFHIEAFPDPFTRARAILSHRAPTNDD